MTIEQEDVIDLIGMNEEENYISLIISDHLEWDEKNEKLLLLQGKINAYLAYIESGQIYETHPESKTMNVHIILTSMYEPNEAALKFFSLLSPILEGAGFHFKWDVA